MHESEPNLVSDPKRRLAANDTICHNSTLAGWTEEGRVRVMMIYCTPPLEGTARAAAKTPGERAPVSVAVPASTRSTSTSPLTAAC